MDEVKIGKRLSKNIFENGRYNYYQDTKETL